MQMGADISKHGGSAYPGRGLLSSVLTQRLELQYALPSGACVALKKDTAAKSSLHGSSSSCVPSLLRLSLQSQAWRTCTTSTRRLSRTAVPLPKWAMATQTAMLTRCFLTSHLMTTAHVSSVHKSSCLHTQTTYLYECAIQAQAALEKLVCCSVMGLMYSVH